MTVELILDEPEFFRLTRLGNWYHVLDYETGTGEWTHESESLAGAAPYIIAALAQKQPEKETAASYSSVRAQAP